MKIRPNSWHLNVYIQAYINDRGWLNPCPIQYESRKETKMYSIAKRKYIQAFNEYWSDGYTQEPYSLFSSSSSKAVKNEDKHREYMKRRLGILNKRRKILFRVSIEADRQWSNQILTRATSIKSGAIKKRLYGGLQSLCPYFRSVVLALLIYYPIVRPYRSIKLFLTKLASIASKKIGLVMERFYSIIGGRTVAFKVVTSALLVSLSGYLVYDNHEAISQKYSELTALSLSQRIENWQYEREQSRKQEEIDKLKWLEEELQSQQAAVEEAEWHRESRRKKEEKRQLAIKQNLEWEKENSLEAQRLKEEREQRKKDAEARAEAREREESAAAWADFWAGLLWFGKILGFGFVGFFGLYIVILGFEWLSGFVKLPTLKKRQPSQFMIWLSKQWKRVVAIWTAFWQVCVDTYELIAAFTKAKYVDHLCPFLTIENGENTAA